MAHRRSATRFRRQRKAQTPHRIARGVGLGTSACAVLVFGTAPLTTAPVAQAEFDDMIEAAIAP
ncbi:hypothetical protein, partial [[Mycobacterium] crassicus]